MRVHVIPHDPFRPIPQKTQSRKDPSREARKFASLKNLVPIPYRDSPLRARPTVQMPSLLVVDFFVTAYIFKLADFCGRFKIVDRFIYFSLSYVVTDLLKSSGFFFQSSQIFEIDMFIGNRHRFLW